MAQKETSKEYLQKVSKAIKDSSTLDESNSESFKKSYNDLRTFWNETAYFAVIQTIRPPMLCNDGTKLGINAGPGWRGTKQKCLANIDDYNVVNYIETNTELRRSLLITPHDVAGLIAWHNGIDYEKSKEEYPIWKDSDTKITQEKLDKTGENCAFYRDMLSELACR